MHQVVVYQGFVQFDGFHRNVRQVSQGGVPDAEVIHDQTNSRFPETVQQEFGMNRPIQEYTFRNFNFHKIGRNIIPLQHFFQERHILRIADLPAGVIDGNRLQRIPQSPPDSHLPDGKLGGDTPDAPDPAVLFRYRDKLGGADFGVLHAYQRFIPVDKFCLNVHLGLVQHIKLVVFNGINQFFTDGMLFVGPVLQFFGIHVDLVLAAPTCFVHGVFRIGDQMFRFQVIHRQGNAHAGAEFQENIIQDDRIRKRFQDFQYGRMIALRHQVRHEE